jgi:hypothetical protein
MCLGWGKGRIHEVICSGSRLKYLCLTIKQREDGSQRKELGDWKVRVLALLKLEVSLPQSERVLNKTAVT